MTSQSHPIPSMPTLITNGIRDPIALVKSFIGRGVNLPTPGSDPVEVRPPKHKLALLGLKQKRSRP